MGSVFSQTAVDSVIVEVTPIFYDRSYDTLVTDITYKKNALFKLSKKDVHFLFGQDTKVRDHSIDGDGKLLYIVDLPFMTQLPRLRAYIKDAWWKFTNAGDPVRANFVNETVNFRTKDVKIKRNR